MLVDQLRTDAKTGLATAAYWRSAARTTLALASRTGQPVTVAVLDLDHFEAVNDVHGHLAGDGVLAAVGARLQSALRAGDPAGRFGGEEFTVMARAGDAVAVAVAVAERLRRAVSADPFALSGGRTVRVTCSVGVARADGTDLDTALVLADAALYAAERAGRDRVVEAAVDAAVPAPRSAAGVPTSRP